MLMDFGKWKGYDIGNVPSDYLDWALAEAKNLRPELRLAMERELRARRKPPRPESVSASGPGIRVSPKDQELLIELVEIGYRQLAKRLHPDHGGNLEKMRQLNALIESLRDQLKNKKGKASAA